ncbi:trihelix transcription factor ENAP1-like [Mercurialis annua]|uniref:trihelix transcription factor ENAP1-like n=1 Tax=Mercurialis annua TaxID=3986 RepID=UPI00215E5759|nr:trihelix transcription factor ENAP1-like [Mercurialis annua]
MDDTEDDARYPPNPYDVNHQQGYGSLNRQKLPVRNAPYSTEAGNQYVEDDEEERNEEDDDEEELGEEDGDGENNQNNGIHYGVRDVEDDDDDDDDVDEDDDEEDVGVDDEEDVDDGQKNYSTIGDADLDRHPKKRKLKSLVSSYEFAPRVPAPAVAAPSTSKQSFAGRNPLTDWTEHETLILLDTWGEKFLQRGRKSLRSEEWQEVAEKVSEGSKIERTDTQCRNRLDTLKKKYKKEKTTLSEMGGTSKWVYFKKMDMLMSTSAQQGGLSCGLDSGEYVFMNPRAYLNRANGLDEMRDSPENTESADEEEDSDGLPPKKRKSGRDRNEGFSFRVLADSIQKFSEIYEKIESNKRQQMLELEKMRMDFHRDLEMQKRQILERTQAEIAKIRQGGGDEENDISADNGSG